MKQAAHPGIHQDLRDNIWRPGICNPIVQRRCGQNSRKDKTATKFANFFFCLIFSDFAFFVQIALRNPDHGFERALHPWPLDDPHTSRARILRKIYRGILHSRHLAQTLFKFWCRLAHVIAVICIFACTVEISQHRPECILLLCLASNPGFRPPS